MAHPRHSCPRCGEITGNVKYCSKTCAYPKPPLNTCQQCGSKFQAQFKDSLTRKFCSRPCTDASKVAERNKGIYNSNWRTSPRTCSICGAEFYVPWARSFAQWRIPKTCSRTCKTKIQTGANNPKYIEPGIRHCAACGTELVYTEKSDSHSRRVRKFCDRRCMTGAHNGNWKGRYLENGYVQLNINGRKISEHKFIAERTLGRPLKKGEIVHHVNGIKHDNRHSNLLICSVSYHSALHQRMSEFYMQEHFPRPLVAIAA